MLSNQNINKLWAAVGQSSNNMTKSSMAAAHSFKKSHQAMRTLPRSDGHIVSATPFRASKGKAGPSASTGRQCAQAISPIIKPTARRTGH